MQRPARRFALVAALTLGLMSLATAGCSGGDDGEPEATGAAPEATSDATVNVEATPNPVDDDGRFFAIAEVGFGENGYVTLSNFTEVPASLAGLYVCAPPTCFALPDVEVEADSTGVVAMGSGEGIDGVVASDAGLDLPAENGEVGLYASEDVTSAQDIRAYVEWGSTPHEGTATAIEAGLWLEGSYVNSSATATRIFRSESAQWVPE